MKNASGRSEVRNAKDAIDAYKNITDAINAAEAAANEAKRAADKALNVRHTLVRNQFNCEVVLFFFYLDLFLSNKCFLFRTL